MTSNVQPDGTSSSARRIMHEKRNNEGRSRNRYPPFHTYSAAVPEKTPPEPMLKSLYVISPYQTSRFPAPHLGLAFIATSSTQTMHYWCRSVVAFALVLLPAVESFVAPGACCRDTCSSKKSEAVPRWTTAISSTVRPGRQPRGEDELLTFRRAHLRMQGGAGYGGAGEGVFELPVHVYELST